MREVNLRGVDLNLLVVLDGLLDVRHITLASEKLGMSQPAVSRALGRLRVMLKDKLLVRGDDGLILTPRAARLQPQLKTILSNIRTAVQGETFDPGAFKGTFVIAATDHQTILLLPQLMARLSQLAPLLDVRVVPFTPDTLEQTRTGKIDFALGVGETKLPSGLRSEFMYDDYFVTLLRQDHPAISDWTLDRFIGLNHVLVTVYDDGRSAIDIVLERMGRTRRIALRLPHFVAAMNTVAKSDFVVTLPASIAEKYAGSMQLAVLQSPVHRPSFQVVSIWADVNEADAAHQFLRAEVLNAAKSIGSQS